MRTNSYPAAGSLREARPITAEPTLSRVPVRFLATREEIPWLKKPVRAALLIVGIVLVIAGSGWAQQQEVTSIVQLKEQIAKLEAVDRDENTPDEVRSVNRSFLEERRTQLKALLEKRVKALQSYLETVSSSLTADEKQRVESSIRSVSIELQNLGGNTQTSLPTKSSVSSTPTSNLVASTEPSTIALSTSTQPVSVKSDLPPLTDRLTTSASAVAKGCTIEIKSPKKTEYTAPDLPTLKLEIKVTENCTKKLLVRVENKQKTIDQREIEVPKGKTEVTVKNIKFEEGENVITVSDDEDRTKSFTAITLNCEGENCGKAAREAERADEGTPDRFSSMFTRGIVGFEQAGASASGSEQKPFLEFYWNPPIWTSSDDDRSVEERYVYPVMSLWGFTRFASVPRQIGTPLATFTTSFLNPISESKVNELVQGFNFLVGIEKGLGGKRRRIGTDPFPTGEKNTFQKLSSYFIVGVGASNPLEPRATAQIFAKPTNQDDIKRLEGIAGKPIPSNIENIAFVSPDRQSFFRQWYAGFRVKTHYFKERDGKLEVVNRPGAVFDFTVGQNEAVTGGVLHGMVLRLDGFYPLPVGDSSIFYLYGTSFINLRRSGNISDPLILATAPSTVTIPNDKVFVITNPPASRDYYRIGFGVNLIDLINKFRADAKKAAKEEAKEEAKK